MWVGQVVMSKPIPHLSQFDLFEGCYFWTSIALIKFEVVYGIMQKVLSPSSFFIGLWIFIEFEALVAVYQSVFTNTWTGMKNMLYECLSDPNVK
jgi:hypothetical protein